MHSRQARLAIGSAALLAISLAACNSDDGPTVAQPSAPPTSASTPATPSPSTTTPTETSPASPTTTSAAPTTPRQPYAAGQCLGPKPSLTVVSCTAPHVYEVFYARNDATHGTDLIKRAAWSTASCNTEALKFLGSGAFVVSRVGVRPMTSAENPNSSSQVACIAYELRESGRGTVTNTASFRGKLAGNSFYQYQICLKGKASGDKIEFVSCREPHAAEGIGGRLWGGPGSPFPGDAKIHADARTFCAPGARKYIGAARSDVTMAENSGGQSNWQKGQMVSGCFVEVSSGTVKKSLRGIGTKPLASYR